MSYILIIEDDEATSLLHESYLKDVGPPIIVVETSHIALDYIKKDAPEIILLDINLPDNNGLDFIQTIFKYSSKSEIIVVTGEKGADKALQVITAGAKDYLIKPVDKERLLTTVTNSLERIELNRKIYNLQEKKRSDHPYLDVVGDSKSMKELRKTIDQISKTREPVCITGEKGAGKQLAAQTIHILRNHNVNEFKMLNCASLLEDDRDLLIDILRGPYKTVYLNELLELPVDLQKTLLRLLDNETLPSIIWSASSDPIKKIKNNKLLENLYYRLHVVQMNVPALREREKDIILLAKHFLRLYKKHENKEFEDFTPKALDAFINYHWPGNVLELSNVVKNIIITNAERQYIDIDLIPSSISHSESKESSEEDNNSVSSDEINAMEALFRGESIIPIRELEEMAIRHALKVCEGNIQKAATNLKISPATLYRKKPPVH